MNRAQSSILILFQILINLVGALGEQPYQCPSSIVAVTPISPGMLQEHRHYNRELHKRIKLWQVGINPSPRLLKHGSNSTSSSIQDQGQTKSFSLLESVLEVTRVACPSQFVSHGLLEASMNAFHFLLNDGIMGESRRGNADPLGKGLRQRIHKILTICQENLPKERFSFVGSYEDKDCPNILIRKICMHPEEDIPICRQLGMSSPPGGGGGFGCDDFRSNFTSHPNIILDVVWKMIDLVHGACAMDFMRAEDFIAYHAWEQAMEKLFSRKMRKYWYHPGMSIGEYQAILHPNLAQQLHNLEMCVDGHYYLRSNYRLPRLQRPSLSLSIFRRRRKRNTVSQKEFMLKMSREY